MRKWESEDVIFWSLMGFMAVDIAATFVSGMLGAPWWVTLSVLGGGIVVLGVCVILAILGLALT